MSKYRGVEYNPKVGDTVFYQPPWITPAYPLVIHAIHNDLYCNFPFALVKRDENDNIYLTRYLSELHKTPHLAILSRMKTNPELKDELEQLLWTI